MNTLLHYRRRWRELRQNPVIDTIVWLAIAIAVILVGQEYVVKPYKVPSESMERTLLIGDRILAARFWYRFNDPKRGEVIVFHPNGKGDGEPFRTTTSVSNRVFVKRLIGLPGDTLRFENQKLQICTGPAGAGCRSYPEPYVASSSSDLDHYETTVPKGCYFMMGDNRGSSNDSRYWGCIQKSQMLGRAFSIYWPLTRIRFF